MLHILEQTLVTEQDGSSLRQNWKGKHGYFITKQARQQKPSAETL